MRIDRGMKRKKSGSDEGRELRMNASEVHGRLSKEIRDEVAAVRQCGALT